MIKNPRTRRTLAAALLALGGVLIFLAPDDAWAGVVLLALGVVLEIAGLVFAHRK
jgi:drug/metabolite transporter (DMT)-like permease